MSLSSSIARAVPTQAGGRSWQRKRDRTSGFIRSASGFGAQTSGDGFRTARFDLTGLTPNTVYSALGGLGYSFQDYRSESLSFETKPDLAPNTDIISFAPHRTNAGYSWEFGFDPTIVPSSFGETFLSVEYGTHGQLDHRSKESRCYLDNFRQRGCKGLNRLTGPGLQNGENPHQQFH